MNCFHCQAFLPEDHKAPHCPYCGEDLPAKATPPIPPVRNGFRMRWVVFFSVLLSPPLTTVLAAMFDKGGSMDIAVFTSLLGGGVAGIICGIMLGLNIGKDTESRVVLSILFSAIMSVVCVALSFFGCVAIAA